MNAEQVVNKIISEAQDQADKIVSEAEKAAEAQLVRLDAQVSDFRKETEALAAEAADDKKSRMLAMARMDIRKEYLTAKVSLLDEVFDQARQKICSMPDDQYRQLIIDLMVAAVQSGDEQVLVGNNETRIDTELIKEVNRKLGPGFKGNLMLANETAEIDSGFILKRKKVQVNVSGEVLIAKAREELEIELSGELFED